MIECGEVGGVGNGCDEPLDTEAGEDMATADSVDGTAVGGCMPPFVECD